MASGKSISLLDSKIKPKKAPGQNVIVVLRCRPRNEREIGMDSSNVVDIDSDRREVTVTSDASKGHVAHKRSFFFDRVFGPRSKQIEVYKSVLCPIVNEVIEGYSCTIFAYGQTGTGKTYTMEGCQTSERFYYTWDQDPHAGVIPRSIQQLFETLERRENILEFSVRVSFLELYNEELYDLLGPPFDQQRLRLFEDATRKGACIVQGLEELIVHNKAEVYSILQRGAQRRQTAATLLNAQSSRSHTVFSVTVNIKESNIQGEDLLKTGRLYLVDLAGSENIGRSGAVDQRAREAGTINQSLLTLGRVIFALVEKTKHVPYRESKLTRLLQDSLGGRTKTVIIATISPSAYNIEETLSTLEYAQRAKQIKNRPEINTLNKKGLIKEYTETIEKLNRDLAAARDKNGIFLSQDTYGNMQNTINAQKDHILELEDQIAAVNNQLEDITNLFEGNKTELDIHKNDLSSAKKWLTWVRDELLTTRKKFENKSKQLREKDFVNSELCRQQQQLFDEATELSNIATQEIENVKTLNRKLLVLRSVASDNQKAIKKFHYFLKNIHDKFIKQIEFHHTELETTNTEFNRQSDIFFDISKTLYNDTTHQLENWLKSMIEITQELSLFKNNKIVSQQNFTTEITKKWLSCSDSFQKSLQALNTLFDQMVLKSKGCISSSKHICDEFQKGIHSNATSFENLFIPLVSGFNETMIQAQNCLLDSTSQKSFDFVKSKSEAFSDVLKKCQEEITQDVMKVLSKRFEEIDRLTFENISEISSTIDQAGISQKEKDSSICDYLRKLDKIFTSLNQGLEMSFKSRQDLLTKFLGEIEKQFSSHISHIELYQKDQITTIDTLKNIRTIYTDMFNESSQKWVDYSEGVSGKFDNFTKLLEQNLSVFTEKSTDMFTKCLNSSTETVNIMKAIFDDVKKKDEMFRLQSIEAFNNVLTGFKKDILSKRFKDVKTGDTPKPRQNDIISVTVPRSVTDIHSSVRSIDIAPTFTPTPPKQRIGIKKLKTVQDNGDMPSFSFDPSETVEPFDKENTSKPEI